MRKGYRVGNANTSDVDRLCTLVRRLRRIEAHPLIAADGGETIHRLHSTQFTQTVFDHRTDPAQSYVVLKFDLPDEVQFESLAARLRPLTLGTDVIGHKSIMDALDALTDSTDLAIAISNAALRREWEEATRRDRKNRGAKTRAYTMYAGEEGDDDAEAATDLDLAYAWLYEDSLHGDVPAYDEFNARDRYQAATHVFAHIAVVALETLAYIRWLVAEGYLDLPEEVFTVDVVVAETKWEVRGQIYVGEPGKVMAGGDLNKPPPGMKTIQEAMRPLIQDRIDAEFERTQPIGDAVNALAQAEEAMVEADGMPADVAQHMDAVVNRLTSESDDN